MQYEIQILPQFGEIRLQGALDAEAGQDLTDMVSEVMSCFHRPLWQIDLSEAELGDGSSLIPLLESLKIARRLGCEIRLTGLNAHARMLLRISRMDALCAPAAVLTAA